MRSKRFWCGLLLVSCLALSSFGDSFHTEVVAALADVLTELETAQAELQTVSSELEKARSEQASITSELTTLRDEQIPRLETQLDDFVRSYESQISSLRILVYTVCGVTLVVSLLAALIS